MRFPRNEEINGRVAVLFEEATTRCSKRGDASSPVGCRFYYIFPSGKMAWGKIISKKPFSWKITHIMSQYSMVQREKMNNFHTHTHKTDASSSPTDTFVCERVRWLFTCVWIQRHQSNSSAFFLVGRCESAVFNCDITDGWLLLSLLKMMLLLLASHITKTQERERQREKCVWASEAKTLGGGGGGECTFIMACTIVLSSQGEIVCSLNIWMSSTAQSMISEPHRWVHAEVKRKSEIGSHWGTQI